MRQSTSDMSVYVNPVTKQFSSISTGSDHCAEHEGSSIHISTAFGAKPQLTHERIMTGAFQDSDFVTSLSDYIVTNQDLLMLIKLSVQVPARLVSARYSKKAAEEIESLKAQLKAIKKPFRWGKQALAEMTLLVTKNIVHAPFYHVDRYLSDYTTKTGVEITHEQFMAYIKENTIDGVLTIKDPEMSKVILKLADVPEYSMDYLRDFLFLRHVEEQGLAAPVLTDRVYQYVPDYKKDQYSEENGFVRSKLYAAWNSPWSAHDTFSMVFGSFDPKVGAVLDQLLQTYRAGKLLVGRHTTMFKGGAGIVLQNIDDVADEARQSIDAEHQAYQQAMVKLRDQAFFTKLQEKISSVQSQVHLKVQLIDGNRLFVQAHTPDHYRSYIVGNYVPLTTVWAWINGEVTDTEIISAYFTK